LSYEKWSADDDATLLAMRKEGRSFGMIAQKLKRSRCSCVGRAGRLLDNSVPLLEGRKRQRDSDAVYIDTRVAQCMADHGETVAATAARLGLTMMQVRTSWRRIKDKLGWQCV
jgi:hypothetical protein